MACLYACQNEQKANQNKARPTSAASTAPADNAVKTLDMPWTAVFNEQTQQLELRQNKNLKVGNWTPQDAIDAVNIKYPQIKLERVKQSNDTIFVRIDDATYLTQQTGSAGARAYLAEATFALTELDSIQAVYFNFKEGDHASPKTYTRADFDNFN